MYEREPIERFLYRMNRKETWAGLFTFAMTVFGLLAVLSLVVLTVWGFSSYDKANAKLNETNGELVNAQQKIAELTKITNSNSSNADLLKAKTDLITAQQQLAEKDLQIADLKNQLANTNTAPNSPVGSPTDCSKCESDKDKRIGELLESNELLKNQLKDCKTGVKRPGKATDRTPILND